MIRSTKARRWGVIYAALLLPLFLYFAGGAFVSGNWQLALIIIGIWGFVLLFATSYVFQALVALCVAVYAFSQQHWLVGTVSAVLVPYLIYASRISDKDMADLPERLHQLSPFVARSFMFLANKRSQVAIILIAVIVSIWLTMMLRNGN